MRKLFVLLVILLLILAGYHKASTAVQSENDISSLEDTYMISDAEPRLQTLAEEYAEELLDHETIQAMIDCVAERYGATGMQVAIINGGQVVATYAYGWATKLFDLMSADHKIRVASISKVVIGITAMLLQEDGIIDIDADIGDYWNITARNAFYPDIPITIRTILTHTSSIISYTYTDDDNETVSNTCVIHISENPEERAACDAAIAEGNASTSVSKYVRIGDSQIIYELDDVDYAILSAVSYDDLCHEEVFWADFEIVTQIDIALEGEEHTLTYAVEDAEDEDADHVWFLGEEVIEIDDVQDALEALTADSFTDKLPSKDEEIGLTLHLDNENIPTVEIRLYRYDGSLCLAVVDGAPVSLVSRSSVMDLVEAVQAIVLN